MTSQVSSSNIDYSVQDFRRDKAQLLRLNLGGNYVKAIHDRDTGKVVLYEPLSFIGLVYALFDKMFKGSKVDLQSKDDVRQMIQQRIVSNYTALLEQYNRELVNSPKTVGENKPVQFKYKDPNSKEAIEQENQIRAYEKIKEHHAVIETIRKESARIFPNDAIPKIQEIEKKVHVTEEMFKNLIQ